MSSDLKELSTIEALDQALFESNQRPVLLFKHSLTCPISAKAFREFQSYLKKADAAVSYNLITVQSARPVSNEAASRLGVQHESPQAILIRNGKEIWNASHFAITADALKEAISQAS
jgi:bacillithiol system protein YtxJ